MSGLSSCEGTLFGQPARVPSGHIRLALKTDAVLVVGYCDFEPTEGYRLRIEPPMELMRTGDRRRDVREETLSVCMGQ